MLSTQNSREDFFAQFKAALPPEDLPQINDASKALQKIIDKRASKGRSRVMVAYGGGKDSSFALAFVRGMQLFLREQVGISFDLRVVTFRHAGMPQAVMDNIDRAYQALGLYDDRSCEMLVVDGESVATFAPDLPLPESVIQRGRADILMTGHRAAGDGRPTFCNACNLNMVNAFGIGAAHGSGVDVIITGDSTEEQRAYYKWTTRLAKTVGSSSGTHGQAPFRRLLGMFDGISNAYFEDVHGSTQSTHRDSAEAVSDALTFFSIYDYTSYESGAHWSFLTDFLNFRFDDVAFSFSESDCGNPGLMAHMRGLKLERVYGRTYAEGISEYVGFATRIMKKKDFPPHLVQQVEARYSSEAGVRAMRANMDAYARSAHGLTEEQLECMLFAPFIDSGANLEEYVSRAIPNLAHLVPQAVGYFKGEDEARNGLVDELSRRSGLTGAQMRQLFRSVGIDSASGGSLLKKVLNDDPHKEVISTRRAPDAETSPELISGR